MRGTLGISWYRGIVATTVNGVVSDGGYWFLVNVVVSSSCEAGPVSAFVVLRTVVSRPLRSLTSLWIALEALRVES